MISVPVTDLKRGDWVRFSGYNGQQYELDQDPQVHAHEPGLIVLSYTGPSIGALTMPRNVELAAARMVRTVPVKCLAGGGHEVQVLIDLAVSAKPHAVICGDCDERITAEVMARMAEIEHVEDHTGEKDFAAG